MDLEYTFDKPAVIKDWNKSVRAGSFVPIGHVILTYEEISETAENAAVTDDKGGKLQRLKATKAGVVEKLLVSKGDVVKKGTTLLLLGPCKHPTVMRDMCAECGMDLRKLDEPNQQTASVSMVHAVPELRVSMEQAQKLGKVDEERLLEQRKLVLLVDLDQTLIHTTNDNVPNNLKDVFHFQLWGHGSVWYHTRLRPHTHEFLDNISKLYELHICTFGTRQYAVSIAHQLDPARSLFSDRILSRDECFSQNSKTANLKELFPRGDHMVCIIDDREDVWNFAPNLIHVKPYHFFRHTGDINAPPGLAKKDQDDKTGFQFDGDKVDSSSTSKVKAVDNPTSESNETIAEPQNQTPENVDNKITEKASANEVATDLNLSEDDSEDNDSGKEEAAIDGDMDESNDEDNPKEEVSCNSSSVPSASAPTLPTLENDATTSEDKQSNTDSNNLTTKSSTENKSAQENNESEIVVEKSESKTVLESPKNTTVLENSENKAAELDIATMSSTTEKNEANPENNVDVVDGPPQPQVIEVEDEDDYLLYLEQILKSIHDAFYSLYDDMVKRKEGSVPDVKSVIPYVRRKVLSKNISIVFSGVVPTHVPLKNSRAYQIAVGLGAHVSDKVIPPHKPGSSANMEPPTTHVVAARMGTAKVNEARRYKGIHIVTPEWLWSCAERWEHVEERLFRLDKAKSVKRNPPAHCSSPSPEFRREKFECITPIDGPEAQKPSTSKGPQPAMRKERTPSGRFMDTINPLLSFSATEIETMAHEVDDIFNESESSSSDDEEEIQKEKERAARRRSSRSLSGQEREREETLEDPSTSELTKESSSSSSVSSDEDDEGARFGCAMESTNNRKRKRHAKTETETEDEPLSVKFRRGEPLPSDIDSLNLMNPSSDDDENAEANEDDEWMAQALEREFLDENSQSQDSFHMS